MVVDAIKFSALQSTQNWFPDRTVNSILAEFPMSSPEKRGLPWKENPEEALFAGTTAASFSGRFPTVHVMVIRSPTTTVAGPEGIAGCGATAMYKSIKTNINFK